MGFLRSLNLKAMTSKEFSDTWHSAFGGGTSGTGLVVTQDKAMRAMAVQSCVTIISSAFGMLPCHLKQKLDGKRRNAEEARLYSLLLDQPNDYLTADKFWGMSAAHIKTQGNFYALKAQLPGRDIRELIPLAYGSVESVELTSDYKLIYKVRRPDVNNRSQPSSTIDDIPGDKIMHLRGLVMNGFTGLNPIAYARESIGITLATERHAAKLFSNGTNIGGVLTMPEGQFFDDRQKAKDFLDQFNSNYATVENSHKAALLENGVSWEKMAMTSVDSQFLEARNFQRQEIVQLMFSIPLGMMTSGDKVATFASSGNFSQDFVTYCLQPLSVSAEKESRRSLLSPTQRDNGFYVKFELGSLLRGDFKDQMESFKEAINSEIMNPNEARDLLDMDPYDGGEEYRTRTSTVSEDDESSNGNENNGNNNNDNKGNNQGQGE